MRPILQGREVRHGVAYGRLWRLLWWRLWHLAFFLSQAVKGQLSWQHSLWASGGGGAMREKRSRIHDGIFFILRDGHSEALGETSTVVKSLCLLSQVFIGVIRSKTAELIMADVISGEAVGREEGLKLVSFSVSRGRWGPQETSRW